MAIPLALANNLTDSGTCQGPTATFQLGRGTHTVPYTLKLFDACHEPMASYANISKTAVSAIFGLVAIITVWNLCVGALLGKFATLPNPGDVLLGAVPEHDKAGLVHFGGDDD